MIETICLLLACCVIYSETGEDWARDRAWLAMTDEQRYEAPLEMKARACGMTAEEFDLMSRVVYAESDRSSSEGMELIALTILNRVSDPRFEDSIIEVCYESGQFDVVGNGMIWSAGRTNQSDWAVIEAHRWYEEDHPDVLFFNNSGYSYGTAYGCYGGNYFVEA